jgi:hypothetical protein
MKKIALLAILAAVFFLLGRFSAGPEQALSASTSDAAPADAPAPSPDSDAQAGRAALADAYTRRLKGVSIQATGRVLKVLPDDNQGSRHQRFLLDTGLGHSLLVAHNIDLAPRIPDLQRGDTVQFKGEYVWNEKGGVMHWTHRDPDGRHPGGWLKHEGRTYE